MSIEAEAADGTIHEFPDGTSGAVIDRAMREYAMQASRQKAAPDPYAGKSTAGLQKMYRGSKLYDLNDKTRARISDAYVRAQEREAGPVGKFGLALDDVVRTGARGVPIVGGLLDEASAGASALMGGNYDEALDYQRARDRRADEQPGSTAVQIAGGVAGTLAGMRGLGIGYGATAAPAVAARTLPMRALTGAAIGAPVGAADFAARGEGGAANRLGNAALGAGFGAVTGAVAPVVAQGLTSGAKRVFDFLASDANLQRLGISREAANVLLRQLGTDDTLTGAGAGRIRAGGPDAMVTDAGPAATNLLDTALERSGPGATAAREAIERRAAGANASFEGSLDTTFGAPVGVETRQAGIRAGTAGARQSAYDAAYAQPIDYAGQGGRQIEGLLQRVPPEALNQANRLMRAEGQASQQIRAALNQDGTVTFEVMPDVRQLDYITRALNEVAQGAEGQGAMRGTTAAGRIYGNLATQIRQHLRTEVPEYATALDTAADPIRRIQATEFGADLLNSRVTREQVGARLQGMGNAERRSVMNGIRDDIDETVANVRRMVSDPNIDARQLKAGLDRLSSEAARQKITMVVGQQEANRFFTALGRQSRALELRASVARNSRTFGRTATDQQVKAQTEPGVIGLAMSGEVPRAMKKLIQSFTGMTPERQLAMEDRLYGEIADALTRVRGTNAERYLLQLQRALQARSNNAAGARAIGTIGADAFVGASPTGPDRLLRPSVP